ncbi:MAG: zinc-ribbon domain-containing protein [Alphaproteobacteria bacterium]|nr:zinc-ribbon domain-containing protein [Alphaproteobacteria bacterium]
MIVTCPQCDTRFKVPEGVFPATGRKVKCSGCGHIWHQNPPESVEAAVSKAVRAAEAAPAEAPASTVIEDVSDIEFIDRDPAQEPRVTAEDRAVASAAQSGSFGRRATAVAFVVLVIAFIAGWQLGDRIIEIYPPAEPVIAFAEDGVRKLSDLAVSGYYSVAVRLGLSSEPLLPAQGAMVEEELGAGLDIVNAKTRRRDDDTGSVLVVEGEVVNTTDHGVDVPRLRMALIDAEQREIQVVKLRPDADRLEAGETTSFAMEIPNLEGNATDLDIRFDVE